jgi:hypothetical protein
MPSDVPLGPPLVYHVNLMFKSFLVLATTSCFGPFSAHAAITLRADADQQPGPYTVGVPFEIRLIIDGDSDTPGDQSVPGGLYSVGPRVSFPAGVFKAYSLTPRFYFDHLAPGEDATRILDETSGFAAYHGNENPEFPPPIRGTATLLGWVVLTPATPGVFTLNTGVFDPARDDNFVDLRGAPLDAQISFLSTPITVVPEPYTSAFASIALATLACSARRRPRVSLPR